MYIENRGKYQDWLDVNYPRLVPAIGPAETFEGELLRAVDAMYFAYYNGTSPRMIITVSSKFLLSHLLPVCDKANKDLLLIYRESSLDGDFAILEDSLERVYDVVCEYIIGIDSYTFCYSPATGGALFSVGALLFSH